MNDTRIKTRHGMILQGITAAALTAEGYEFEADAQYDASCEQPDFLIPSAAKPKFMIEVHQTDVRNSLAMKILRAFVAVTEAKAHFGASLVSVNLVFGDPDEDFSSSPLSAISAIYDVNIFPARDKSARKALQKLEKDSLEFAADENYSTQRAIDEVCSKNAPAIATFGAYVKSALKGTVARPELKTLWEFEKKRQQALGAAPNAGTPTYYKRMMLGALFFTDAHFDELIKGLTKEKWPSDVAKQLVSVGLATVTEEIDGDHLVVHPEFLTFLKDSHARRLRNLCREVLDSVPDMHWYFEDIRDAGRRTSMAKSFVRSLRKSPKEFSVDFRANVLNNVHAGIEHRRAWYADLTSVYLDQGFNVINKLIYQDKRYPLKLWSPFNNLALKWSAHERKPEYVATVCDIVGDLLFVGRQPSGGIDGGTVERLADGLAKFRVRSSIKLRRLNPLEIVFAGLCVEYGLKMERIQIDSLLFDLAADSGVGRFLVYAVSSETSGKRILANAVAVHDGHGDDKSKEWGARRVASIYRFLNGQSQLSEFREALFVLDGEWEDKDIARLHRCGWNHICRLSDLEGTLKKLFGLKGKVKGAKAKLAGIALVEGDVNE